MTVQRSLDEFRSEKNDEKKCMLTPNLGYMQQTVLFVRSEPVTFVFRDRPYSGPTGNWSVVQIVPGSH